MIEFPCEFPIKIMFTNHPGVLDELLQIVRRHHPELTDDAIRQKLSKENTYCAMTATVMAQSQTALDALYLELTQHPHTKMVL